MLKPEIIENMQKIVDGCMGEETPDCQATCHMHTNVREYVRLIGEGKGEEAIKVIRDKLFLPASLGRICAHPCEKKCKWNEGKSPILQMCGRGTGTPGGKAKRDPSPGSDPEASHGGLSGFPSPGLAL